MHAAEFLPSLELAEDRISAGKRKEAINLLFCGHVDAGKSTLGGQLMFVYLP